IVRAFDGQFVAGEPDDNQDKVVFMVAAMSRESFGQRLQRHHSERVIVFVGDREEIQADAINAKVLGIVIIGALGVSAKIRSAAKEAGVRVLSSRYDPASTVLSARGAPKVDPLTDAPSP